MFMYFLVSYLHKPKVSSEACSLPFVSFLILFPAKAKCLTESPYPYTCKLGKSNKVSFLAVICVTPYIFRSLTGRNFCL